MAQSSDDRYRRPFHPQPPPLHSPHPQVLQQAPRAIPNQDRWVAYWHQPPAAAMTPDPHQQQSPALYAVPPPQHSQYPYQIVNGTPQYQAPAPQYISQPYYGPPQPAGQLMAVPPPPPPPPPPPAMPHPDQQQQQQYQPVPPQYVTHYYEQPQYQQSVHPLQQQAYHPPEQQQPPPAFAHPTLAPQQPPLPSPSPAVHQQQQQFQQQQQPLPMHQQQQPLQLQPQQPPPPQPPSPSKPPLSTSSSSSVLPPIRDTLDRPTANRYPSAPRPQLPPSRNSFGSQTSPRGWPTQLPLPPIGTPAGTPLSANPAHTPLPAPIDWHAAEHRNSLSDSSRRHSATSARHSSVTESPLFLQQSPHTPAYPHPPHRSSLDERFHNPPSATYSPFPPPQAATQSSTDIRPALDSTIPQSSAPLRTDSDRRPAADEPHSNSNHQDQRVDPSVQLEKYHRQQQLYHRQHQRSSATPPLADSRSSAATEVKDTAAPKPKPANRGLSAFQSFHQPQYDGQHATSRPASPSSLTKQTESSQPAQEQTEDISAAIETARRKSSIAALVSPTSSSMPTESPATDNQKRRLVTILPKPPAEEADEPLQQTPKSEPLPPRLNNKRRCQSHEGDSHERRNSNGYNLFVLKTGKVRAQAQSPAYVASGAKFTSVEQYSLPNMPKPAKRGPKPGQGRKKRASVPPTASEPAEQQTTAKSNVDKAPPSEGPTRSTIRKRKSQLPVMILRETSPEPRSEAVEQVSQLAISSLTHPSTPSKVVDEPLSSATVEPETPVDDDSDEPPTGDPSQLDSHAPTSSDVAEPATIASPVPSAPTTASSGSEESVDPSARAETEDQTTNEESLHSSSKSAEPSTPASDLTEKHSAAGDVQIVQGEVTNEDDVRISPDEPGAEEEAAKDTSRAGIAVEPLEVSTTQAVEQAEETREPPVEDDTNHDSSHPLVDESQPDAIEGETVSSRSPSLAPASDLASSKDLRSNSPHNSVSPESPKLASEALPVEVDGDRELLKDVDATLLRESSPKAAETVISEIPEDAADPIEIDPVTSEPAGEDDATALSSGEQIESLADGRPQHNKRVPKKKRALSTSASEKETLDLTPPSASTRKRKANYFNDSFGDDADDDDDGFDDDEMLSNDEDQTLSPHSAKKPRRILKLSVTPTQTARAVTKKAAQPYTPSIEGTPGSGDSTAMNKTKFEHHFSAEGAFAELLAAAKELMNVVNMTAPSTAEDRETSNPKKHLDFTEVALHNGHDYISDQKGTRDKRELGHKTWLKNVIKGRAELSSKNMNAILKLRQWLKWWWTDIAARHCENQVHGSWGKRTQISRSWQATYDVSASIVHARLRQCERVYELQYRCGWPALVLATMATPAVGPTHRMRKSHLERGCDATQIAQKDWSEFIALAESRMEEIRAAVIEQCGYDGIRRIIERAAALRPMTLQNLALFPPYKYAEDADTIVVIPRLVSYRKESDGAVHKKKKKKSKKSKKSKERV
ncbi:hypothetical protein BZA70DRAFT_272165 [Myxozyma melibiosi]|uniref:Uncharacterized protein n=1 Tax=Myxozyma melibiosi TaxID=54550 RepID=A0ABR1FDD0_9ASCO